VPTNKPQAGKLPYEGFREWHNHWYREYAPELFSRVVRPGTIVVIDAHDIENTGFIGSNNALSWRSRGMARTNRSWRGQYSGHGRRGPGPAGRHGRG
jgi:hypothetical protein